MAEFKAEADAAGAASTQVMQLYRRPGPSSPAPGCVASEYCFNIELSAPLSDEDRGRLIWLLSETFEPANTRVETFLTGTVVEAGPRMAYPSAFSTNAVNICAACGIGSVRRVERSRRYQLESDAPDLVEKFTESVHDRMTEQIYEKTLTTFGEPVKAKPVETVPVMAEGRAALERANDALGLAFDDWDLDFYTKLFRDDMKRDPTDVELFDMSQSNSEHSRHWFFGGRLIIDGVEQAETLFRMVKDTLTAAKAAGVDNSVIAFKDNSSAIAGYPVTRLVPKAAGGPGPLVNEECTQHLLLTAETHNFPTGVAPHPGAETGTGGRIRDVQATGIGAHVVAGTAGYCVGNLHIPSYELPWEDPDFVYPSNLAPPLQIEIEASNGASEYGNKFGEPVITGFTRSFGQRLPGGERREWVKPIMFSAGLGQLDARHVAKGAPEPGMLIVKLGGPAYRIGMGGGAASSRVQDAKTADLDFDAVQRGDAEMENKMNRVVRACIEMGAANPIISIHDQGAGGNSNVLKEIAEPTGCLLEVRDILVADPSMSVLEIWGAEYQENNALLLRPEKLDLFRTCCEREKSPFSVVGKVTDDGRVILHDSVDDSTPVNLDLNQVLGELPQKTFDLKTVDIPLNPLDLPASLTVAGALDRVFRLISVGSKRFLTTKVDRSVSGLVAQQQCVGPLHIPLADVAVMGQGYRSITGAAASIGEAPIKGLLDTRTAGSMAVGEAVTNLMWARIESLNHVKCSANWMWAAKLPGEGAAMHRALKAMRDVMIALGVSVDGGKDSLSMAAKAGDETVKAPGMLTISLYAPCPDVTMTVTPDFKDSAPDQPLLASRVLFVDLSGKDAQARLGGSALAQVFGQLGNDAPALDAAEGSQHLKAAFGVTQELISQRKILAGHDRSDGGLITTVLEMALAGNLGITLDVSQLAGDLFGLLFAEELGFAVQVAEKDAAEIVAAYTAAGVRCFDLGATTRDPAVKVTHGGALVLDADIRELRDLWEATSFELEKLQANPDCVSQEQAGLAARTGPQYVVPFVPTLAVPAAVASAPRVAVLREEGSNGDREMLGAFDLAGFEVHDITLTDFVSGRLKNLDGFKGAAFVGGFSFADVLGSAKGWAGVTRFNDNVWAALTGFYKRQDTFSLGVCNGCQLMALLGATGKAPLTLADESQPRFIDNTSGRFESRFSTVTIEKSPAIMFKGMEGMVMGVWVAHGEGRAHFPDDAVREEVLAAGLAPLRYVGDDGKPTESYPANPNGSPNGIAGLVSPDGRHLSMMPHPERAFRSWQMPYAPESWKAEPWFAEEHVGPWLKMFQNAYAWSLE